MRSSDDADDPGAAAVQAAPAIRPHEFRQLQQLVLEACGIRLRSGKEALVRARLAKRLSARGTRSFRDYLAVVRSGDADELRELVDALTTNKTAFFREQAHFEFMRAHLVPAWAKGSGPLRIWSAGCSTGEEAYSLAIVLAEQLPTSRLGDLRILATDVSSRVVTRAKRGRFAARALGDLSLARRRRFFAHTERAYVVRPELSRHVRVARLNLLDAWPMHGPFDLIVCRNVMIYFDATLRQQLVERFHALLKPGGHLFVGHSESLGALSHRFHYVQPAIYAR